MRLTLKFLEEFGKKHGIKIERTNRRYSIWKFDHTEHEETNLKEAYACMLSLVDEEDPDRIVITSNSFAMHTKAYEELDTCLSVVPTIPNQRTHDEQGLPQEV